MQMLIGGEWVDASDGAADPICDMASRTRSLRLGRPLDPSTDVGPLIGAAAARRCGNEWKPRL